MFLHVFLLFCMAGLAGFAHATESILPSSLLTLEQAQAMALAQHPALAQAQAQVDVARARSAYAGALSGPQFRFALESLPTDSLRPDRDEMSQLSVGISQMFAPLAKRRLERQAASQETRVELARRADARAQLRREVEQAWLDCFALERELALHHANIGLAGQMVQVALSALGTGQGESAALISARLVLSELQAHERFLLGQRRAARSRLSALLGQPLGDIGLPEQLPPSPPIPAQPALLEKLPQHPQLLALSQQQQASDLKTRAIDQERKPDIGLEANYAVRLAQRDERRLPDLLSLGLLINVPLPQAQQARYQEAVAQRASLGYQRELLLRQLHQQVEMAFAESEGLRGQGDILEQQALTQAQQVVEARLADYQAGQAELAQVLAARRERLALEVRVWQLRVAQAKTDSALRYLASQMQEDEHAD